MNKTNSLVKGALICALTMIFLYISNVLPTNRLALLTLTSALVALAVLSLGLRWAFITYLSSTLLSFILGLRASGLVYGIFFGVYPIIKYYIEKIRRPLAEIPLKLLYFNMCLFLSYYFYTNVFMAAFSIKFPLYMMIIAAEIAFIIYDYALTLIISFINKRLF